MEFESRGMYLCGSQSPPRLSSGCYPSSAGSAPRRTPVPSATTQFLRPWRQLSPHMNRACDAQHWSEWERRERFRKDGVRYQPVRRVSNSWACKIVSGRFRSSNQNGSSLLSETNRVHILIMDHGFLFIFDGSNTEQYLPRSLCLWNMDMELTLQAMCVAVWICSFSASKLSIIIKNKWSTVLEKNLSFFYSLY